MRRASFLVALGAVAALTTYASATAVSVTTGAGSSAASAAQATAGTITTPVVTAKLLGLPVSSLLAPLTTDLATPLVNLPATILSGLATGITGAGLSATNPSDSQPRTSSAYTFPTCGQQGWIASGDCYGPIVPGVSTAAVALSVGAAQGYATGDPSGYIAAARTADPNLSLLGVNLGDLGVVESSASCTTSSVCTPDQQLSGGSLFSGALTYSLVNGKVVAQVAGVTVGTTPVTVTSAVKATVSATNLLTLTITLSTTQLLGALGYTLSTLGALLGGTLTDNSTTATLTVGIGPGNLTTAGSGATAWGLDVAASLTADIKLNLSVLGLGLVALEVTATGQLLDFKLAYSSATAGTVPPQWLPPGLI